MTTGLIRGLAPPSKFLDPPLPSTVLPLTVFCCDDDDEQMTSTYNQVDGHDSRPFGEFFRNGSDHNKRWSSFDAYFESTKEYHLLLALHGVVPPILVSFNCLGTAFTLAAWRHLLQAGNTSGKRVFFVLSCRSEVPLSYSYLLSLSVFVCYNTTFFDECLYSCDNFVCCGSVNSEVFQSSCYRTVPV